MQLPEDFVREMQQLMGEERFNSYLEAFHEDAPVSIRLNPMKSLEWRVLALQASRAGAESLEFATAVPWCEEGYYLEGRPQFTFDPLFHAGCYYVQEAASMFITHILRALANNYPLSIINCQLALDLCAAPGGKSTAMLSVLPEGSTLVSNEPVPTRAQILLENITKWGAPNCIVTNNYPRDFRKAKAKFDMILCDVLPPSVSGVCRMSRNAGVCSVTS